MKKILLLSFLLTTLGFAAQQTNSVESCPAVNGFLVLTYNITDTSTCDTKDFMSFIDKNNNIYLDNVKPDDINQYKVTHFDGKTIIIKTSEGVSSDYNKYILYKVTKKGLKKIGEQEIIKNAVQYVLKPFVAYIYMQGTQWGAKVFDKKLKRELFGVALADGLISKIFPNGVVVREKYDNATGGNFITYYKKGEEVVTYALTNMENYAVDAKCGLLYWTTDNFTNSPLTYLNKNHTVIFENLGIDVATPFWHVVSWDGKNLYVLDMDSNVSVYKVGKQAKKLNTVFIDNFNQIIIDKSKLYFLTLSLGTKYYYFDCSKNLSKCKYQSASCDKLLYLGKGVFVLYDYGINSRTLTYLKNNKKLTVHSFQTP